MHSIPKAALEKTLFLNKSNGRYGTIVSGLHKFLKMEHNHYPFYDKKTVYFCSHLK